MSLYDDLDTVKQKTEELAGWSSSTKLFQSQLQVKKAASTTKRENRVPKTVTVLAPVFDLNSSKKDDEDRGKKNSGNVAVRKSVVTSMPFVETGGDDGSNNNKESNLYSMSNDDVDWNFGGEEYDPLWPNDYEKVVKDLREMREREKEKEDEERLKKRDDRRSRDTRFDPSEELPKGAPPTMIPPDVDIPIEDLPPPGSGGPSRAGAAIAPPPSLVEQVVPPKVYGASVAAKIMAKYGFKEGQGLGKKEQGISMALQVEKTSKRGGRIVHEKEMMPPPPPAMMTPGSALSPPNNQPGRTASPPPVKPASITEMMKAPSKVVLLKNMVGPGEVDEDLEPEVKDECNTKYGDVIRVIIYELPDASPEEAVRIFVEFKRIESAIKAVVDLNGRFFGGRQVMAGFYPTEKLENLELLD